jgi:cell division protein FtsA
MLGEDVLGLPVRIGRPRHLAGLSDILHEPAYATSVGLLRWALREQEVMFRSSPLPTAPFGGLLKKAAHLMRLLLPQ